MSGVKDAGMPASQPSSPIILLHLMAFFLKYHGSIIYTAKVQKLLSMYLDNFHKSNTPI